MPAPTPTATTPAARSWTTTEANSPNTIRRSGSTSRARPRVATPWTPPGLARAEVATDPRRTLELLETARGFDPYNEQLYVDIMRIQRRLGRADSITRTLALLTTRLAEIDETTASATVQLAA